jgi:hypothetical protein
MKDWHLCLGSGCFKEDDFEELNCAKEIEIADPEDLDSLGEGRPGCDLGEYCDDGLYRDPCVDGEKYEFSADVYIDYTEVDPEGLIPSHPDNGTPVYEVDVPESELIYVDQYSFGFWYQWRFRSPDRVEVDEKRSQTHAVAGVTEGASYCSKTTLGDRALGIFFEPWSHYTAPTYTFCSYDAARGVTSACKEQDFEIDAIDGKWYYVYSGYSVEKQESYSAFYGNDIYVGITNPQLTHNIPPAALKF